MVPSLVLTMIHIVTALHIEAAGIIEMLRMQRDVACKAHQVFRCESASLIISGTGRLASAIATTRLLSEGKSSAPGFTLNFGLCAASPEIPEGTLAGVHSLIDQSTGRSFFPDLLLRSTLPHYSLTTVDAPASATDLESRKGTLIDMEGAGFFQASTTFLPPSQCMLLKLVSDHGTSDKLDLPAVRSMLAAATPMVLEHVEHARRYLASGSRLSAAETTRFLEALRQSLRLTQAQSNDLEPLLKGYHALHGTFDALEPFTALTIQDKHERTRALERLQQSLAE